MSARICLGLAALCAALAPLGGCGCPRSPAPAVSSAGRSDPEKVRSADVSILFVGNSHTSMHDVPKLVCDMIRFRHPDKTTYAHTLNVAFLEDVARDPRYRDEIESREWKFVVLQAQKISVSGKHDYSRAEGIEFARAAKARGATVYFFCEWGLKGVPDNGPR
jgi:hypothetical protein